MVEAGEIGVNTSVEVGWGRDGDARRLATGPGAEMVTEGVRGPGARFGIGCRDGDVLKKCRGRGVSWPSSVGSWPSSVVVVVEKCGAIRTRARCQGRQADGRGKTAQPAIQGSED